MPLSLSKPEGGESWRVSAIHVVRGQVEDDSTDLRDLNKIISSYLLSVYISTKKKLCKNFNRCKPVRKGQTQQTISWNLQMQL